LPPRNGGRERIGDHRVGGPPSRPRRGRVRRWGDGGHWGPKRPRSVRTPLPGCHSEGVEQETWRARRRRGRPGPAPPPVRPGGGRAGAGPARGGSGGGPRASAGAAPAWGIIPPRRPPQERTLGPHPSPVRRGGTPGTASRRPSRRRPRLDALRRDLLLDRLLV